MRSYEFTAVNILQKYNFSREDAEAFLETIKEAKSDDNATKGDIKNVEERIVNVEKEIQEIKKDIRLLDVKIESNKSETIKWAFLFWISQMVITFAMFKFFLDK